MVWSAAAAKRTVREQIITRLARAGFSPQRLGEIEREVLWWTWPRIQAARQMRPLLMRGQGIAWGSGGYAELVPVDVSRPGKGQVTIETTVSAVSPGTERAQYLHLPNTAVGLLGRPGYSSAGVVLAAGRDARGISAGDRVAVTGAAHASIATADADAVFPIPDGVSDEAAALSQIGIIAGQGVTHAGLVGGERVVLVGAGLVGTLALRIAVASGAVADAVIARSRSKEKSSRRSGASEFLLVDDAAVDKLEADVVIESTGDPEGIGAAVRAAGRGARIVLLGSPRGTTRDVPVADIRRLGLRIVGAHVDTLDQEEGSGTSSGRRREGERFIRLLSDGGLEVGDLAGEAVDPREAGIFYRRLAEDRSIVAAHFDWRMLDEGERHGRGHLLVPPAIAGKGVAAGGPPTRPASRLSRLTGIERPFEAAGGHLRFGILGCGDIGVHNSSALGIAPNTEVVACYDPDERLAESLAKPHGAVVMESAEALCANPDVDAVLVCAPHHLHAPLAALAIDAGRHVVVEKPLTSDLPSAVELADRAARAGVVLTVCFPQRFEPEVMIAAELVRRGLLGTFTGAAVSLYLDKTPAYWSGGFSGRSISDWRRSKEKAGGGVLIMNLSHHIDLLSHLSGEDVDSVTATTDTAADPDAIESSVVAGLRYENGATGSIVGGASVRGTTGSEFRLWGTEGHVALEPAPRAYTLRHLEGLRPGRWQSFGRMPVYSSRAVFMSRFASAVSTDRPVDVSAEDGLAVQAVIEAAYLSAATGRVQHPAQLIREVRK